MFYVLFNAVRKSRSFKDKYLLTYIDYRLHSLDNISCKIENI